jgi:hypothetical protein
MRCGVWNWFRRLFRPHSTGGRPSTFIHAFQVVDHGWQSSFPLVLPLDRPEENADARGCDTSRLRTGVPLWIRSRIASSVARCCMRWSASLCKF